MNTEKEEFLHKLQKAVIKYETRKLELDDLKNKLSEPIAIVGMSCRFPGGANDPESFWKLLEKGFDCISEIPKERWNLNAYYDPNPETPGKMYMRLGGFLNVPIDQFDSQFFAISPKEAEAMDPQQRLLLEVSWEALENAGCNPKNLAGSTTGVFIGACSHDYYDQLTKYVTPEDLNFYMTTGNTHSVSAGRISYFLNLQGPCMSLDTACSSSLTAVHEACKSLHSEECSLALAGGINILLNPDIIIEFCNARAISPEGHCKTFDAKANGYVRSEGCGMVVLKRLSNAIQDKDRILALIRGTAVNQDGASSGLTVPNGEAQAALIQTSLRQAKLDPSAIDYIEAHGTGTPLGDPIEAQALNSVFSNHRDRPLWIGSVKTNIGHVEGAAGIAGLIKMVLSLQHEALPKHLHFEKINPLINLEAVPIKIPLELTPWLKGSKPRLGGISSFGISGTNAHVIVEEAPAQASGIENQIERPLHILALSARSEPALREMAKQYQQYLPLSNEKLTDTAFTANVGRAHFENRLTVIAQTKDELLSKLQNENYQIKTAPANPPKIAFLFTGQGSQYANMGKQLYATQPVFKKTLDFCAKILNEYIDKPLLTILFDNESSQTLDQTGYTQPALFAFEYALTELWKSWGIIPNYVMGHSAGEYVAATVAGILSLEDGLKLIAARARLMQTLPAGGAMAALKMNLESVKQAINQCNADVEIGAINAPEQTVISGKEEEVNKILDFYKPQNIKMHRLHVSHASHSKLMDPMINDFLQVAQSITYHAPQIPFISNLTGKIVRSEILTAQYWADHIRSPVKFYESIQQLHKQDCEVFLEVGPHPVLMGLGAECVPGDQITWLPSLRRDHDDWKTILESLAQLYLLGFQINWKDFDSPYQRNKVVLPTYPFQRTRHWAIPARRKRIEDKLEHPLLGRFTTLPSEEKLFENELSLEAVPFLEDHQVFNKIIFPGAGFVEMALATARKIFNCEKVRLENFEILEPLSLSRENPSKLDLIATPIDGGKLSLKIYSLKDAHWINQAAGIVSPLAIPDEFIHLEPFKGNFSVADLYDTFAIAGLEYGKQFQTIKEIALDKNEVKAELQTSEKINCLFDPRLFDGCLQALGATLITKGETYLPIGFDKISLFSPLENHCRMQGRLANLNENTISGDLEIFNLEGKVIAKVEGFHIRKTSRANLLHILGEEEEIKQLEYQVSWVERPISSKTAKDESWLIISDRSELADHLSQRLKGVIVSPEDAFQNIKKMEALSGCIYLWENPDHPPTLESIYEDLNKGLKPALYLVKELLSLKKIPFLCFVTKGAQSVENFPVTLSQTPFVGFFRTLIMEYPELKVCNLDLDPSMSSNNQIEHILTELSQKGVESQVAFRKARYVPRFARFQESKDKLPIPSASAWRLDASTSGNMEDLHFTTVESQIQPDEIAVEVHTAGVNFRDVLYAMGLIFGQAGLMGSECSGKIIAVGNKVTELKVGDEVIGFGSGCFANIYKGSASLFVLKPSQLTPIEAASIPVVFGTAYQALYDLAKLKKGDKILIHAAAGGVGLASIQIAQLIGAEIYATAGSDEKRAYLNSLGVSNVYHSRSLNFADQILKDTKGKGVDVVLNSLTGEGFIEKSISACAKNARFIEIGKRDIWTAEQMSQKRPDIQYFILALDETIVKRPLEAKNLLQKVVEKFSNGSLKPIPITNFQITEALSAFQYLQKAKNIGKIVLTLPQKDLNIDSKGSYLITGGLGALGLKVAEWLVQKGAKHLVLIGRKAPSQMPELGVSTEVAQVDVADTSAINSLMQKFGTVWPELKGIIHSAGLLDDGALISQDWTRFEKVFAPKIKGSWNLHEASINKPLDFFVLFSSMASSTGSAGQINYASANAFLDGLAAFRRQNNLPAISINWSSWAEIGLATGVVGRHQAEGVISLKPAQGIKAFEQALKHNKADIIISNFHWKTFLQRLSPSLIWISENFSTTPATKKEASLLQQIQIAVPDERNEILSKCLQNLVRSVLGLSAEQAVNNDKGFFDSGMDSLMAITFRNKLQSEIGQIYTFPTTFAFDYPSITAIIRYFQDNIFPLMGISKNENINFDSEKIEKAQIEEDEIARKLQEKFQMRTK